MTALNVQPTVAYCKEIQVGKTFLMTVDFDIKDNKWEFEEEEYSIYFIVQDNLPHLSFKSIQDSIVVHRFGGSYGPAKFLVKGKVPGQASLKILAINQFGVPLASFPLKIEVKRT